MRCFSKLALVVAAMVIPFVAAATDEMTVYDLLPPETHKFAIRYDTSALTAGAQVYFNIVRPGSVATDERVIDRATGKELPFTIVNAKEARKAGEADDTIPDETKFIKVALPHPVPASGEYRLRIYKTYEDPKSYYSKDGQVVFERSLGILRNVVILPAGYELVSCSVPVIVSTENGRIRLSMVNDRDDELGVKIVARSLPEKKQ